MLISKLLPKSVPVGRFLAEHVERRAKIEVDAPALGTPGEGISAVIEPSTANSEQRFQIHLRGQPGKLKTEFIIDIGGFAAMDPNPDNRVVLSTNRDCHGTPNALTRTRLSSDDKQRTRIMCDRIREIVAELRGRFVTHTFPYEGVEPEFTDSTREIQAMPPGRSYHEAGTLRMGMDWAVSVTNEYGQVHGVSNIYVADASLFPCVGVANPMLTITALAYRVADYIARQS